MWMKVILYSESIAQLTTPALKMSLFHGYAFRNILLIMEVTLLPGFSKRRGLAKNGSNTHYFPHKIFFIDYIQYFHLYL